MNPRCLSLILNCLSTLLAINPVKSLRTMDEIVSGRQLLMLSRPSLPLGRRMDLFSLITREEPGVKQVGQSLFLSIHRS